MPRVYVKTAMAALTKAFSFALEQHYGFEVSPISDLSFGSADHFWWTHTRFFSEDAKPESLLQLHTKYAPQQSRGSEPMTACSDSSKPQVWCRK